MRYYINGWFVVAIILFLAIVVLADAPAPRYQMIAINGVVWTRSDTLPYAVIRPMCWDASTGFCDDISRSITRYTVIDYLSRLHGIIRINRNSGECYVWWFYPDYGDDNNPHMVSADWIECP